MLKKQNRLDTKKIPNIAQKGKKISLKGIKLSYQLHPSSFAITFIIPKKVIRLATDRNKLKRKLREIFRIKLNQNKLPLIEATLLVVDSNLLDKSLEELQIILENILDKIEA